MQKLYFGNKGLFDVRAMLTFGVSAKESEDAIGYFGTGFKYAIAIILRLGGSISVKTGDDVFEFTVSRETIRNKEFDVVKVNGKDAGFTTRLGINWQPWQAFRELWCNCKDEGGECSPEPLQFDTVIEVCCDEIHTAYSNRAMYFIEGDPTSSNPTCDIFDKSSHFAFYRGVAVYEMGKHALFGYNIKNTLELTEDRTVKIPFYIGHYIKQAVQSITDKAMLRRILTAPQGTYEHEINFDGDYSMSKEFIDVANHLVKQGAQCNDSARRAIKKKDELSGNWPRISLTNVQQKMVQRARSLLDKIGIDTSLYPINFVDGLGDGIMGRALEGEIYLSLLPFNMGTKQVASTLIEEWVHIKMGCGDFDRQMQSWLFDKILSLAEEINGDPI